MTKAVVYSSSARRRPKGNKRERTRTTLLEAARQLVHEKGFEHATLEEVAKRAGMTTGAIYGNFKNREELFVALGQAYWPAIKPKVKPGATLKEIMRALAKATIAAIPERKAAVAGRLRGLSYSLCNEELLAQVQEVTAQSYAGGAQWLRSVVREDELPMPAEKLVRVIHALSEGLILQALITPKLFSNSVYYAAFDALASAPRRVKSK
jgi:AcrR family transcriptional regulator